MFRSHLLALTSLALLLSVSVGRAAPADEIPATARRLLEEHEKATKALKKKAEADLKRARTYGEQLTIKRKLEANLKQSHKKLLASLQMLEASFKKEAKFPQALAVHKLFLKVKEGPIKALPDPGTLIRYRGQVGKTFYFRVTGVNNRGTVWGTDLYTDDSMLAKAVVHAGILPSGQTGIVKVTVLGGQPSYQGSTRNGVATHPYGRWSGSYRIEAVPK